MEQLSIWETLILGIVLVAVFFLFGPGIKQTFEQSRQAQERDWKGFLLPLVVMVAFIVLLIMLARG